MKYYSIEERARRHYGTTEVPEFAGYMLQDGTMLNFSYEGHQRDCDHRDIAQFFKNPGNEWSGTPFMDKFIRRGNIRCSCNGNCYGFEFDKTPTRDQWETLKELGREADKLGLSFIAEKKTKDGFKRFDIDDLREHIDAHVSYALY